MEKNGNFELYNLVVLKEGNNNPLDYQNFKLYQIIDVNAKLNDEEVYIIQDVENQKAHKVVKAEELIPFFIKETEKVRGFEVAKGWEDKNINLPVRKTKNSAGYDVEAAEDTVIKPFKPGDKPTLVHTGLKAYCQDDEWFMLANRSSNPGKRKLVLSNGIGVIDRRLLL